MSDILAFPAERAIDPAIRVLDQLKQLLDARALDMPQALLASEALGTLRRAVEHNPPRPPESAA